MQRDKAGGYANYVGVVVAAGQYGQLGVPADGGADALVLVGGYGNPIGAAANQNAKVKFAAFNGQGHGVGKVGVIAGGGGISSEILYLSHINRGCNSVFKIEAGMVAPYDNF